MPLELFPALWTQNRVVQMHAMEATTTTCERDPGLNLDEREVSESHCAAREALDPVRAVDVGLKTPKEFPSKTTMMLPVEGDRTGSRALTVEETRGAL